MTHEELFVTKNIYEYLDHGVVEFDAAFYLQIAPYVDYYMTNDVCLFNSERLVSSYESRVFVCLIELTNFLAEKYNDGYVVFLRKVSTTNAKEFKFCGCFYERNLIQKI